MTDFMKGSLLTIREKEKDLNDIEMETPILEISKTGKLMEKVFTNGLTMRNMMENGKKVLSMETVCGEALKEIATLVNGFNQKPMDVELIFGLTVIGMKECGTCA